jgi:oligogalacturonide transport system substrate-binding protein
MITVGQKLKQYDKTKTAFFAAIDQYMYLFKVYLKQKTGNDVVKDDYTIGVNQQDVEEFLSFFRRMVDTGTIPSFEEMMPYATVYPYQVPYWLNQQWILDIGSVSHLNSIKAASKFNLGVARFPLMKGYKNPALITPTAFICLNSRSPNIDEAAKFIDWLMNDDEGIRIMAGSWGLPAVKKAQELLTKEGVIDPLIPELVNLTVPYSGGPEGALSQNQEVINLISEYLQQVGYKRLAPRDAAARFMTDLKALVDNFKSRK